MTTIDATKHLLNEIVKLNNNFRFKTLSNWDNSRIILKISKPVEVDGLPDELLFMFNNITGELVMYNWYQEPPE